MKANIHINVKDLALDDLIALRQKIQQFLASEDRAELLLFQVTEES